MNEDQAVDRRIVRTRIAIREALVSLINEKGFDALTVKDIVVRANINRSTFYRHYRDKFDLLERTEKEILDQIQGIFLRADLTRAENLDGTDQLQQLAIQLLQYVKEQMELMHAILGLQGDYSFVTRIRSTLDQNLDLGILLGLNAEDFLVPREYLIAYLLHAHLGILQTWLASGCRESPREMARILFRLSLDGPMYAAGLKINRP